MEFTFTASQVTRNVRLIHNHLLHLSYVLSPVLSPLDQEVPNLESTHVITYSIQASEDIITFFIYF